MLRPLLGVLLVALALPAVAQVDHDVVDGIWFIHGADGNDTISGGCDDGMVKANGGDPASGPTACGEVDSIELDLRGGDDFLFLFDLEAFSLSPSMPGTFDGGPGDDLIQVSLDGFPGPLDAGVVAPPTGPPVFGVGGPGGLLFEALLPDPTSRFVTVLGPGDDTFTAALGGSLALTELQVFSGAGDDTVDGGGTAAPLPLFFSGGEGDDVLIAGGLHARLIWQPGDGSDRIVSGTGASEALVFGTDDPLGLHLIRGFLDPSDCAIFDFLGGGGIIYDALDAATFTVGTGGIDLFTEVDCDPDFMGWDGSTGSDRSFLQGGSGGGNRLELDFELGQAIFTDGFESGDVSAWSSSSPDRQGTPARGGTLWDGIDYQDWPSFADPASSGPSRVVIRGKPDFPVSLDMGPDGATGRGGAVDSLLVDPLGLPFTDDGSQIVIDGGPPIAYSGVEVVRVGAPTATADGPGREGPALAVFPNPTVGGGRVRLDAPGRTAARVVVLDVLAREVAVLHDGPLSGAREWRLSGRGIAPGVYMVLAHGAGWVVSQRMVVAE